MSAFKFECPACGQHISSNTDLCATPAVCPTCKTAFTVPSTELSIRIALVNQLGLTYRRPWAAVKSDLGEDHDISALDKFFDEVNHTADLLEQLETSGGIAQLPDPTETLAIHARLFSRIIAGTWDGTETGLKNLIAEGAPELRVRNG